jgi:hypothetical protein
MNEMKNIDMLIMMNDLQEYTKPYSTGVSQSFPSEKQFEQNRLARTIEREGSIRNVPFIQSEQGMQAINDLIEGISMPGPTAIGSITKTGSILKNLLGRFMSKKKFPIGYGERTKKIQNISQSEDEALNLLKEFGKELGFGKPPVKGTFAGVKNLTIKQQDDFARELQQAGIKIDDKGNPYSFKTDAKESWESVNKRFKEIKNKYLTTPEPTKIKSAEELGIVEKKIWK